MAIELLNRGAKKIINIDMNSTHAYQHDYYECLVDDHNKLADTLQTILSTDDIDLYHSNAGQVCPDNHEFSLKYWQHMIDVNFLPHVVAVQNIMPYWLARNKGHMLITASAAALTTMPGSGTYTVTKSATLSYAEFLAMTYTDKGIGTTVICPRGVNTGMNNSTEFDDRVDHIVGPFIEAMQVVDVTLDAMLNGKYMVTTHADTIPLSIKKAQDPESFIKHLQDVHKECLDGYDYTDILKKVDLSTE